MEPIPRELLYVADEPFFGEFVLKMVDFTLKWWILYFRYVADELFFAGTATVEIYIKIDEFCNKNDELCIQIDE